MSNKIEALKPLTKCEKKLLSTAVVYGWYIEIWANKTTGHWDGDLLLPVRVGAVVQSLICKGYMEYLDNDLRLQRIRATQKAKELRCWDCSSQGRIYDEEGMHIGDCPRCEFGILPEASNG